MAEDNQDKFEDRRYFREFSVVWISSTVDPDAFLVRDKNDNVYLIDKAILCRDYEAIL